MDKSLGWHVMHSMTYGCLAIVMHSMTYGCWIAWMDKSCCCQTAVDLSCTA